MATVIINDFLTSNRTEIMFNYPQDFEHAETVWNVEDGLLLGLQNTESFHGRTRWSDLTPLHYRFLLIQVLNKVALLSDAEQADCENETMVNLTFCLSLMIKCIEERCEANVELLRINRHGEQEMLYDFVASSNMPLEPKPKKGFRVVVDNT